MHVKELDRLVAGLKGVCSSEKSHRLAEWNVSVFKVAPEMTKGQVKKVIQAVFRVDVEKVTLLNVKGKRKQDRVRRGVGGVRKSWRKAYVRVAEGQSIDFKNITVT